MSEAIYGEAAQTYWDRGWRGVLPFEPRTKWPPPSGTTGRAGENPSYADVYDWAENERRDWNIGLRLPAEVIGIDVDAYGGRTGAATLIEAERRWGTLPHTVRSTSRGDSVSGIRLFRIPVGVELRDRIKFPEMNIGHIEIVQPHHRYVMCWPSVHPDTGATYRWLDESCSETDIPSPEDLPELPAAWVEVLRTDATGASVGATDVDKWLLSGSRDWLSEAAEIRVGERDSFFHSYASSLRARGGVDQAEARALMKTAYLRLTDATDFPLRQALDKVAAVWDAYDGPEIDDSDAGGTKVDESTGSSWSTPVALNVTDEYEPTVPTILAREDGQCLIYPGLTHSFHGEPESGKSLVVQYVAATELMAGRGVFYLDFESDAHEVSGRFRALGVDQTALDRHLIYVRPRDPFDPTDAGWRALLERPYSMAVIDGVTEAMVLAGKSPLDNQEAAQWLRMLPDDIAVRTGAAVVMIDHVTKAADGRGRSAIGAQHKLAGITGAAYVVEPVEHLGRGVRGVVALRVAKDRPGSVRAACGEYRRGDRTQEAARCVVDSTGPGLNVTVAHWQAEARVVDRAQEQALTIANLLATHRSGLNQRQIVEKVRASAPGLKGLANGTVGVVLAPLMAAGLVVEQKGWKNSRVFRLADGVSLEHVQEWAAAGGYQLAS